MLLYADSDKIYPRTWLFRSYPKSQ